ncbi:hypothetical protein RND71_020230 [Anisodus tanguticus]|uniref:Uncharacterized protein n=1 Tax=Anisodus tanguticus TaxID=243964 RepID=A0AAE1S205_9SOLA|nr:hypothetical protein RND71_020230 [Anisodus tanguticus]
MPSGPKKRKAAKKKQQLQAKEPPSRNDSFLARSHGEEDSKRDDKYSDSESGSPASQDNQYHQNQFTEWEVGNGDKQLDVSHDWSIDENESNGVKHEGGEVDIVGNEDGGLVQVGGLRRSSSSSSSSSSSNSSVEKYVVAVKNNIVLDDAPTVELVKENESLPDKNNIVVDDAPVVELVKENESLPDTQVADSLVGTTSTSNFDKAAISDDIVQVTTSASDADNVTASTVEPSVKGKGEENLYVVNEKGTASDTVTENWDENLGAIVDKATISEFLVETETEKRDEATTAVSNDNALENTDAKASVTLENEEKIEAPDNAPKIDAGVCADNVKDSPTLECHDHQITALPSRPVETTSWKSCCGLFELFAGSNR